MHEQTEIMFDYKELVELLIKKQDIHEGIWALSLQFGMRAANIGSTPEASDHVPSAIVGVLKIGIHRHDKETNLSVDAAKVNPAPKQELRPRPRH